MQPEGTSFVTTLPPPYYHIVTYCNTAHNNRIRPDKATLTDDGMTAFRMGIIVRQNQRPRRHI